MEFRITVHSIGLSTAKPTPHNHNCDIMRTELVKETLAYKSS